MILRILADSNIVAQAVRAMREAGHDVVYVGERKLDPGDAVLLAEAAADARIFVTKDHDIGVLVHRDRVAHRGVIVLDDLGDPIGEARLLLRTLDEQAVALEARAFLRVSVNIVRSARLTQRAPQWQYLHRGTYDYGKAFRPSCSTH